MLHEDIGYSRTSLRWTYILPTTGRETTAVFGNEYKAIGERALDILNAAKRTSAHGRPHTIQNKVQAIRLCVKAIAEHEPASFEPQEWLKALEIALRKNDTITEGSRNTYFGHVASILKEVARVQKKHIVVKNPFVKRTISQKPLLHGDDLVPLIVQARRDAYSLVTAFRSPDPDHAPYIQEARALSRGGLFIPGDVKRNRKDPAVRLGVRWFKEVGLNLPDLTRYLYPSPDHILPLLLSVAFPLAANPDSISFLRLSDIREMTHPAKGPGFQVALPKPRAGEIPQVFVRDNGRNSPGWMLRAAIEITEPLRKLAARADRDYVFLCATRAGGVGPLIGSIRYLAMRRYLEANCFPLTTLKALRSARLTDEWIDRRDPMRVWKLHGGTTLAVVASYVLRAESEAADAVSIAEVQRSITIGAASDVEGHVSVHAVLPTHTCADVGDPSKPKDSNGFCVSYLWPYNDAHFVFQLEPRPVAFLLRDYQALCEAEKNLTAERFKKRYLAKKRLIETNFLPLISEDLMLQAKQLLSIIPAHPIIYDTM